MIPRLHSLPPELRHQIFRELLTNACSISFFDITADETFPEDDPDHIEFEHDGKLHTAILKTCRQFYDEGAAILYWWNLFRFDFGRVPLPMSRIGCLRKVVTTGKDPRILDQVRRSDELRAEWLSYIGPRNASIVKHIVSSGDLYMLI